MRDSCLEQSLARRDGHVSDELVAGLDVALDEFGVGAVGDAGENYQAHGFAVAEHPDHLSIGIFLNTVSVADGSVMPMRCRSCGSG